MVYDRDDLLLLTPWHDTDVRRSFGAACLAVAFGRRRVPFNALRFAQLRALLFLPFEHHISRVTAMSHDHEYLLLRGGLLHYP